MKHNTLQQKIIEIIGTRETWEDYARRNGTSYQNILDVVDNYDHTVKKLTELFHSESKAYLMEVIGENEDANYSPTPGVGGFDIEKVARNELRAEQRKRAGLKDSPFNVAKKGGDE